MRRLPCRVSLVTVVSASTACKGKKTKRKKQLYDYICVWIRHVDSEGSRCSGWSVYHNNSSIKVQEGHRLRTEPPFTDLSSCLSDDGGQNLRNIPLISSGVFCYGLKSVKPTHCAPQTDPHLHPLALEALHCHLSMSKSNSYTSLQPG